MQKTFILLAALARCSVFPELRLPPSGENNPTPHCSAATLGAGKQVRERYTGVLPRRPRGSKRRNGGSSGYAKSALLCRHVCALAMASARTIYGTNVIDRKVAADLTFADVERLLTNSADTANCGDHPRFSGFRWPKDHPPDQGVTMAGLDDCPGVAPSLPARRNAAYLSRVFSAECREASVLRTRGDGGFRGSSRGARRVVQREMYPVSGSRRVMS